MAIVYLNGRFVPAGDARVGVFDGGWLHGAGLFETMRAENGRIFRLEAHVARLRRSAEKLIRPIPAEALPTGEVLGDLLAKNGLREARVRLTVSSGPMLEAAESEGGAFTVCATVAALSPQPSRSYEQGIQVAICPYQTSPSDPLAGHKTTAYLSRLLGLREAQAARCMEALWFTTRKQLAEGCISNVFLVKEGGLHTPTVETPVLPGITRSVVLELAERMNVSRCERDLSIHDLLDAEEVFLTNSIMEIMPVVRVERKDIAGGKVGSMTRTFMQAYRELVRQECGA